MFWTIWNAINGYKTYLLVVAGIVYAWLGAALGHDTAAHAWEVTYQALLAGTIRNGISKADDLPNKGA